MAKQYSPKEKNAQAAADLMTDPASIVPPQAVELEEAVLGALMLEKDAVIEVQGLLTPEAFYKETHQIIYKAILDLSMELKPIDLYTVTEKLKQIKFLSKSRNLEGIKKNEGRILHPYALPVHGQEISYSPVPMYAFSENTPFLIVDVPVFVTVLCSDFLSLHK